MKGNCSRKFICYEIQRLVPAFPFIAYLRIQRAERAINLVQRQALGAQAAEVRRVGRVASYRNNFIVGDRSEYPAANAAVAAERGDLTPRFDQNKALFNPRGVHRNPHRAVLDAAARDQAEMLLVDRRGDDQLALDVADYSAR